LITFPVPTCLVHNCETSWGLLDFHLLSPLFQDQIPFDPHQWKLRNKRNLLKKTYEKDTSNTPNCLWHHPSSLSKRTENCNHVKTIVTSMNIQSRTFTQYLMFKPFWTNFEDQNTSPQWTYNSDTTTSEFENKINGKEHSGQIKDYLNQLSYSLKYATVQQHFKR